MVRFVGLLIAGLLVAGCASTGVGTASPAAPGASPASPAASALASPAATVSVAEAAALRDAGAFVLDVREPAEWTEGHIPGATLIPLGELASRLGELQRDQLTVVVCRSGNRSAEGRDILRRAGFAAVTSLDGGMVDWARAGMPIETGT